MLEGLILLGVAVWTVFALRSAKKHPSCGGDCEHCAGGCEKKERSVGNPKGLAASGGVPFSAFRLQILENKHLSHMGRTEKCSPRR